MLRVIRNLKKIVKKSFLSKLNLKKGQKSFGFVELITPEVISGWVLNKDTNFLEVRLIDNEKVLASTLINIFREDVSAQFNVNQPTGFNLKLDSLIAKENLNDPKLIAINSNGKTTFEIKLTHNNEFFKDKLSKLLNSDFLGCKGKVFSISDEGRIIGWAYNTKEKKEIEIWLQSGQSIPIRVKCDLSLYKLPLSDFNEDYSQLPLTCGINLTLNECEKKLNTKELVFTFDKEGIYPLEMKTRLFISNNSFSYISKGLSKGSKNLINYLTNLEAINQKSSEKNWLPWRFIAKSSEWNDPNEKLNYSDIFLKEYLKKYHKYGENILSYLKETNIEKITQGIKNYFDYDYYRSYSDLKNLSDEKLLEHYVVHGKNELNRNPNAVFDTSKFVSLYPWITQLNINPLFLFINWPEQFIEFKDNILYRSKIISNEPFSRKNYSWALHDSQKLKDKNHFEYRRILNLVENISANERKIKPDLNNLKIHFIIPDFSKGSGGHMTIFRFVKHLESFGHDITIWIKDYNYLNHLEGPEIDVKRYFQDVSANIMELNSHFAFACGDAIIATSWDTAELVKSHKSFNDKFYFVQDFEPFFYPRGSQSLKSEETYKGELKTICASKWLDKTMREKYNKKSCYFDLSFSKEIFDCPDLISSKDNKLKEKDIIRIAFYGRIFTERRAVEIALEGLEELSKYGYKICLELFGVEKNVIKIPNNIEGIDNGILSPFELSKIYKVCDIGIAFSATNYSLVPPEMMASGLPVLELATESNRMIYPENVVKFAEPNAKSVSNAINDLIQNDSERYLIINNAYKWITSSSWQKSFKKAEQFIKNEVKIAVEKNDLCKSFYERYKKLNYHSQKVAEIENCLVSIVIPTYNGGELLLKCIDMLFKQEVDFNFEILIIDSSSDDKSVQSIKKDKRISIYSINQKDFQHGRTRNLAVSLSKGEYVAFLTQDAIPSNKYWLKNILKPLINDENTCAVFGRHIAHKNHSFLTKESISNFFDGFKKPYKYRIDDDLTKYFQESPSERQALHYYSDNNSCLRKSYWESFPYQDVDYGEDQLWADWIIKSKKIKAFAHNASVFHSHEYSLEQEFERCYIEAKYFLMYFGYDISQNRLQIEVGLETQAKKFISNWQSFYSKEKVNKKHQLNLLRVKREAYKLAVEDTYNEILMTKSKS